MQKMKSTALCGNFCNSCLARLSWVVQLVVVSSCAECQTCSSFLYPELESILRSVNLCPRCCRSVQTARCRTPSRRPVQLRDGCGCSDRDPLRCQTLGQYCFCARLYAVSPRQMCPECQWTANEGRRSSHVRPFHLTV